MTDPSDLSVTVTADTEEFVEGIEDATEALDELHEAVDKLEDEPVSIEIQKVGEMSITRLEVEDSSGEKSEVIRDKRDFK